MAPDKALASRNGSEDRVALLRTTRRIPAGALDHEHLYRVWHQMASHGYLEEALEAALGTRRLPPNAHRAFRGEVEALLRAA